MAPFPSLKKIYNLTLTDFEKCPLWMNVHGEDEGEPWYDETDEATYRAWDRALPYDLSAKKRPSILVVAQFRIADGRWIEGFISPPMSYRGVGDLQPVLLLSGRMAFTPLYQPLRRLAVATMHDLQIALKCNREGVFPLMYEVKENFVTPRLSGALHGIYFRDGGTEQYL